MSDSAKEGHASIDRRTLRTRQLLADALISLGAAGDVDALEVGEIASEAGVARSTFYAHFASKDDFLIRSYVNMLAATEAAVRAHFPDRAELLPSRSLFEHIHQAGAFALRMAQSDIYPQQMAAGELKLREIAEKNLERLKPEWPLDRRRATAVYVAGGFVGLIRWWKQTGLKETPDRMQAVFEQLTQSALEAD